MPNRPALVIQTAFLGDVVLTTPLLTRLADRHGPLDVVTTPAAAPLLETHPAVRRVVPYDKRGTDRGWAGFQRTADRLRDHRYGRAYLPHRSWRTAALAFSAQIPERVGFEDSPAAFLYTERVRRPVKSHESMRLLALAGPPPRGEAPPPHVTLALTEDDRAAAGRWLAAHGVDSPFVAVAPGSIWGTKRWPYYPEFVARLDRPVVLIGGADDVPLAAQVAAAAPGRAHSAAGQLSLRESAAIIERAELLVTNDSAPLHFATGVGTPTVAIFGPTVPAQGFGPIGRGSRIVQHPKLWCRPCSPHGPQVCPFGHHRCMRETSVEQVEAAVGRISLQAAAH